MITRNDQIIRFASAARAVLEGNTIDPAAGRYSRTVFMVAFGKDAIEERCAIEVATGQDISLVSLNFGHGSMSNGPRCCTVVGHSADGSAIVAMDCALHLDEDGTMTVVTRGPGADGHFVSVEGRLEHRPGRPASMAGGMVRANRALIAATRTASTEGTWGMVTLGAA